MHKWIKQTSTIKLSNVIFVSFVVVRVLLLFLKEVFGQKHEVFLAGASGLLVSMTVCVLGILWIIRGEIPFSETGAFVEGSIATVIGWIAVLAGTWMSIIAIYGLTVHYFLQ